LLAHPPCEIKKRKQLKVTQRNIQIQSGAAKLFRCFLRKSEKNQVHRLKHFFADLLKICLWRTFVTKLVAATAASRTPNSCGRNARIGGVAAKAARNLMIAEGQVKLNLNFAPTGLPPG
jgi:hypothetical protein